MDFSGGSWNELVHHGFWEAPWLWFTQSHHQSSLQSEKDKICVFKSYLECCEQHWGVCVNWSKPSICIRSGSDFGLGWNISRPEVQHHTSASLSWQTLFQLLSLIILHKMSDGLFSPAPFSVCQLVKNIDFFSGRRRRADGLLVLSSNQHQPSAASEAFINFKNIFYFT